ncbi:uncharacterized protein LOC125373470 [Haliotis rufescens]|uniref:uncharacterized protein LOC125373470 n=1 Tax=Haliotis rufescens TaxID=6454 RepID=UPI00201E8A7F|nr:uncharacterized protein LOC125373470 [Haliotis rufescens]
MLIEIHFHFHLSTKRTELYKSFQEFCDVEPDRILKHVQTRWLSLERCVKRTLEQWPALKSYFTSHEDVEKPGRVKTCCSYLNNDEMTKLYFLFMEFILPPLNEFNTTFQKHQALLSGNCDNNVEVLNILNGSTQTLKKSRLSHQTQSWPVLLP